MTQEDWKMAREQDGDRVVGEMSPWGGWGETIGPRPAPPGNGEKEGKRWPDAHTTSGHGKKLSLLPLVYGFFFKEGLPGIGNILPLSKSRH